MLQFYYRCPDVIDNNFAAEDKFLQLNCAGEQVYNISLDVSSVRQDNYLMYVAGGKISVKSPAVCELEAGDFAVLGKNETFHYVFAQDLPIDYFWVHFGGYGAVDLLESCGIKTNTRYRIRDMGMHDSVTHAFGEVFDVLKFRTPQFDAMANAAVLSLVAHLSRCVASEPDGHKERLKDRLSGSLGYIHTHYTEEIDIASLAAMDFLSPGRYRVLFREMMNASPLEYITKLRMNMARELLMGTKLDIAAVAEAVGYGDARYFSRVFRKTIGCTPREYRMG